MGSGHRVQRLIKNSAGEVIGVEADTAKGKKRFFARKAVVFCTGGFTHNVELRKNFQAVPIYGGCAANSNEGDFVYIASTVGAQLRNMNYAWMCPIVLEKALNDDPSLVGTFSPSGDSMIYVNQYGKRVTNEKLAYNESAQAFTAVANTAAARSPKLGSTHYPTPIAASTASAKMNGLDRRGPWSPTRSAGPRSMKSLPRKARATLRSI